MDPSQQTVEEQKDQMNKSVSVLSDKKDTSQMSSSTGLTISLLIILKGIIENGSEDQRFYIVNLVIVCVALSLQFAIGILIIITNQAKAKINNILDQMKTKYGLKELGSDNGQNDPKPLPGPSGSGDSDKSADAPMDTKLFLMTLGDMVRQVDDVICCEQLPCCRQAQAYSKTMDILQELHNKTAKEMLDKYDELLDLKNERPTVSPQDADALEKKIAGTRMELDGMTKYLKTVNTLQDLVIRQVFLNRAETIQNYVIYLSYITVVLNALLFVFGASGK